MNESESYFHPRESGIFPISIFTSGIYGWQRREMYLDSVSGGGHAIW